MKKPKLLTKPLTGQDFSFRFNDFDKTYSFAVMLKTTTGDANIYCDLTEAQAKALITILDTEVKRDKNDELV